jgi:hypothetical protein
MDSMRSHQFEVEHDGSAVKRPADVVSALLALWPMALAAAVAVLAERYWPRRKQLTDWLRWLHASVLFALGASQSGVIWREVVDPPESRSQ